MPALTDDPKYVGDVWVVEEIDHLVQHAYSMPLGVFDTLAGAQKFSTDTECCPHCTTRISKIAYYTTNWSDTIEE